MGKIRRLTIYSDKIFIPKKILVYSDLHMAYKNRDRVNDLIYIKELSPDLFDYILIPGDIVHGSHFLKDEKTNREVIESLKKLTGDTKTFVSLGNHDLYERISFEKWKNFGDSKIRETLSEIPNIKVLDSNRLIIEDNIEFSAINNSAEYYLRDAEDTSSFVREYLNTKDKINFSEKYFSILLTHDPKSIYEVSKYNNESFIQNTDLVVSGHMHNGFTPIWLQTKMNGIGLLSPDYTILPEFAYGIKQVKDTLFLANGAVSGFVEIELINKLLGINCTTINLEPSQNTKKLTYTYK